MLKHYEKKNQHGNDEFGIGINKKHKVSEWEIEHNGDWE